MEEETKTKLKEIGKYTGLVGILGPVGFGLWANNLRGKDHGFHENTLMGAFFLSVFGPVAVNTAAHNHYDFPDENQTRTEYVVEDERFKDLEVFQTDIRYFTYGAGEGQNQESWVDTARFAGDLLTVFPYGLVFGDGIRERHNSSSIFINNDSLGKRLDEEGTSTFDAFPILCELKYSYDEGTRVEGEEARDQIFGYEFNNYGSNAPKLNSYELSYFAKHGGFEGFPAYEYCDIKREQLFDAIEQGNVRYVENDGVEIDRLIRFDTVGGV